MNRDDGFLPDGYGVVNLGDPERPGTPVPAQKKKKGDKNSADKKSPVGKEKKVDE